MLLSVIVPIYNAARWLDQCIDSITTSRFSDFELLLINDGSTDSSSQICRNHAKADTRLRVYDKPNGGVSSARNFALDRAQGKWLTFCDADDFVSPDLFAELIGVAQQAPHLEFVHGGCTNYREKFSGGGTYSPEQQYVTKISDDPELLINDLRGLLHSKLFLRQVVQEHHIKFDETMKVAEDLAFTYDYVLHIARFAFVDTTGYYYRRHDNSASTSGRRGYHEMLYGYRHLRDSLLTYVCEKGVRDYRKKKRYLGNNVINLVYRIHATSLPRSERLLRMRDDFTVGDYANLRYTGTHGVKRLLELLLLHGHMVTADLATEALFMARRTVRWISEFWHKTK